MAERLTRNNKVNFYFHDEASNMVYYKLQNLEDIMEKYGIEDLEQYLLKMRKVDKELRDTIQQLHTIIDSIGYDRDTWKRACELACNYMCKFVIPCPDIHRKECESFCNLNKADCYKDYFFQQAKKDWNDE